MKHDTLSVLVVDDEPEARDLLTILLGRIEGVTVAGYADNVDHALLQVARKSPDLILLDIQMPEKNGFDLVHQIRKLGGEPGYIFVTAYDQYAIRAVRESAFDYLLKPVDPGELEGAIARYRLELEKKSRKRMVDDLLAGLGMGKRLKLNTRTGFMVIDPHDIVCCIADGNYTEIPLADGRRETVSINLGKLERELSESNFFRISRSALIGLKYLTYVENRTGLCRLSGASPIELKVVRNRLGKLEAGFKSF